MGKTDFNNAARYTVGKEDCPSPEGFEVQAIAHGGVKGDAFKEPSITQAPAITPGMKPQI